MREEQRTNQSETRELTLAELEQIGGGDMASNTMTAAQITGQNSPQAAHRGNLGWDAYIAG